MSSGEAMLTDVVDLIDCQFELLERLSGIEFLRELHRSLRLLETEPRVHELLMELRHETDELSHAYERFDAEQLSKLRALQQELVSLAPESNEDASVAFPEGATGIEIHNWWGSMAAFNHVASGGRLSGGWGGRSDGLSRSQVLINILF